jgi:hypothetical protein
LSAAACRFASHRLPSRRRTDRLRGAAVQGFQFYDTWVQTILSRVTFRNFFASKGDTAVRYMDHSGTHASDEPRRACRLTRIARRRTDQFLPQGINSVQGLFFDNVTTSSIVAIRQCGPDCNGTSGWAALVTASMPAALKDGANAACPRPV